MNHGAPQATWLALCVLAAWVRLERLLVRIWAVAPDGSVEPSWG